MKENENQQEEQKKAIEELESLYNSSSGKSIKASELAGEALLNYSDLLHAHEEQLKNTNVAHTELESSLNYAQKTLDDAIKKFADFGAIEEDATNTTNTNTDSLKDHDAIVKAVTDSLDTLNSTISVLNKAQKEVSDNGKISLNTLNDLVKKYPELTDTVNEYISGVKTESDVIAALKKVYEEDVDDYNNAIKSKTVTTTSFYSQLLSENAQLVNDMKEKYEVDLSNYTTVQEAKADVAAKVQAKIRAELYKTAYQQYIAEETRASNFGTNSELLMANISGNANSFYADTLKNSPQALQLKRDTELADTLAKEAGDRAAREISAVVDEYYSRLKGTASADSILDLASGSDSGTGNNKNTVSVQGWGTTASGSSYTQATLTLLNRAANLGTINDQQTIAELQRLLTRGDITNDEIYSVKHAIKQATERIEKAESEALAREQQQYQEQLDLALAAYEKLVNDKIDLYKAEAEAAQKAADAEIAALDAVLKKRKEEQADAQRKAEIDKINARLEYDQLDSLSRYTLEKQLQNLLNEQAEIDFERDIERQKAELTAQAAEAQNQSAEAIAGLQAASAQMSDHMARLAGTQSNSQIVNNNNQQQNISIIQNALTDDQVVDKLMRLLYDD